MNSHAYTIEELAAIALSRHGYPKISVEVAREELNLRVWARIAPLMEKEPLPLSHLLPCRPRRPS